MPAFISTHLDMALQKRSQQYIHCSFVVTSIHPSITITNHEIRTEAMCRLKKRERETDGSLMKSFISIRTNHSLLIPETEVSRDYFYSHLVGFIRRLTEQFVPFQHYDMELRYRRLAILSYKGQQQGKASLKFAGVCLWFTKV